MQMSKDLGLGFGIGYGYGRDCLRGGEWSWAWAWGWGLDLGLDVVGIRERMKVGWGLEGIYVGVVVGFRVEVGAEVGKGWLG